MLKRGEFKIEKDFLTHCVIVSKYINKKYK